MLILERRKGGSVFIGKDKEIEVVVTDIQEHWVKLCFKAPREIPIVRDDCKDTQLKDYNE